jgi:hypothetical protein
MLQSSEFPADEPYPEDYSINSRELMPSQRYGQFYPRLYDMPQEYVPRSGTTVTFDPDQFFQLLQRLPPSYGHRLACAAGAHVSEQALMLRALHWLELAAWEFYCLCLPAASRARQNLLTTWGELQNRFPEACQAFYSLFQYWHSENTPASNAAEALPHQFLAALTAAADAEDSHSTPAELAARLDQGQPVLPFPAVGMPHMPFLQATRQQEWTTGLVSPTGLGSVVVPQGAAPAPFPATSAHTAPQQPAVSTAEQQQQGGSADAGQPASVSLLHTSSLRNLFDDMMREGPAQPWSRGPLSELLSNPPQVSTSLATVLQQPTVAQPTGAALTALPAGELPQQLSTQALNVVAESVL